MNETILLSITPTELKVLIIDSVNACLDIRNMNKPVESEEEKFLTIKETSDLIKLSPSRIYTLFQNGKIPGHKKGQRLLFNQKELIEWIKTSRRKSLKEIDADRDEFLANKEGKKKVANHDSHNK